MGFSLYCIGTGKFFAQVQIDIYLEIMPCSLCYLYSFEVQWILFLRVMTKYLCFVRYIINWLCIYSICLCVLVLYVESLTYIGGLFHRTLRKSKICVSANTVSYTSLVLTKSRVKMVVLQNNIYRHIWAS